LDSKWSQRVGCDRKVGIENVGRVFNVSDSDELSTLEWAEKIASAMGWTGEI